MKLAVKLLKRSDLTFFEPQFRLVNAGNQKSLNLSKVVLIDQFYPALAHTSHKAVLPVRLHIWGPDAAERLTLSRSITKEAKNWRLNGEFVHNPDVEPGRFDGLHAGDIALLRFDGAAAPEAVSLVIVSATDPEDRELHARLLPLAGNSMRAISAEQVLEAMDSAPAGHPARLLVPGEEELADLEDAATGDPAAARRAATRRKVSREELAAARERAGQTGVEGESLVAQWLVEQERSGAIRSWKWVAEENAVSPYDFELEELSGERVRVEVKTTSCAQGRPFHISLAEVVAAAEGDRYELYRLSELSEAGAALRRTTSIHSWAGALLDTLEALPKGVVPQSFLVEEGVFEWSPPQYLASAAGDGDEL